MPATWQWPGRKGRTGVFAVAVIGVDLPAFWVSCREGLFSGHHWLELACNYDGFWWSYGDFGLLVFLRWEIERNLDMVECCGRASTAASRGRVCDEGNPAWGRCRWQDNVFYGGKRHTTENKTSSQRLRRHHGIPGPRHTRSGQTICLFVLLQFWTHPPLCLMLPAPFSFVLFFFPPYFFL